MFKRRRVGRFLMCATFTFAGMYEWKDCRNMRTCLINLNISVYLLFHFSPYTNYESCALFNEFPGVCWPVLLNGSGLKMSHGLKLNTLMSDEIKYCGKKMRPCLHKSSLWKSWYYFNVYWNTQKKILHLHETSVVTCQSELPYGSIVNCCTVPLRLFYFDPNRHICWVWVL